MQRSEQSSRRRSWPLPAATSSTKSSRSTAATRKTKPLPGQKTLSIPASGLATSIGPLPCDGWPSQIIRTPGDISSKWSSRESSMTENTLGPGRCLPDGTICPGMILSGAADLRNLSHSSRRIRRSLSGCPTFSSSFIRVCTYRRYGGSALTVPAKYPRTNRPGAGTALWLRDSGQNVMRRVANPEEACPERAPKAQRSQDRCSIG